MGNKHGLCKRFRIFAASIIDIHAQQPQLKGNQKDIRKWNQHPATNF